MSSSVAEDAVAFMCDKIQFHRSYLCGVQAVQAMVELALRTSECNIRSLVKSEVSLSKEDDRLGQQK